MLSAKDTFVESGSSLPSETCVTWDLTSEQTMVTNSSSCVNSNPTAGKPLTIPSERNSPEVNHNALHHYILYENETINDDSGNKYEVLELLGTGEYGQVARCKDLQSGQEVAIKIIRDTPAHMCQSMMEVRILELLKKRFGGDMTNTVFVNIKSHFFYRGHLCLVLELLGLNLYDFVKRNGYRGLSLTLVRKIVEQVLQGLCELHAHNIVHGDLKLENVLLRDFSSTRIKIIDFGSSSFGCNSPHHMLETYIQSRHYRAPEVLFGHPFDRLIDVWSVGCLAAELFLGYPLFAGTDEQDQIKRIVTVLGPPPPFMQGRYIKTEVLPSIHERNHTQTDNVLLISGLDDLLNAPHRDSITPAEKEKEIYNRRALVHFLRGLLQLSPYDRWTPEHALRHPFITGAPFNDQPHVDKTRRRPQLYKREMSVTSQPERYSWQPTLHNYTHAYGDEEKDEQISSSIRSHSSLGFVSDYSTSPQVPNVMHNNVTLVSSSWHDMQRLHKNVIAGKKRRERTWSTHDEHNHIYGSTLGHSAPIPQLLPHDAMYSLPIQNAPFSNTMSPNPLPPYIYSSSYSHQPPHPLYNHNARPLHPSPHSLTPPQYCYHQISSTSTHQSNELQTHPQRQQQHSHQPRQSTTHLRRSVSIPNDAC